MKLISWNIRGLNGRSKQRLLRERIIVEQPDIMFLQETKCAMEEMDRVLSCCWKQGKMICTDAIGTTGGLASSLEPELCAHGKFLHHQVVNLSRIQAYWIQQTWLPHKCVWTASPRDKTSFICNLEGLATLTSR
jgi:endonuclease/exonuclease/phosphatase family metal-dependent hydrolase